LSISISNGTSYIGIVVRYWKAERIIQGVATHVCGHGDREMS
jgi:hypothetical protein